MAGRSGQAGELTPVCATQPRTGPWRKPSSRPLNKSWRVPAVDQMHVPTVAGGYSLSVWSKTSSSTGATASYQRYAEEFQSSYGLIRAIALADRASETFARAKTPARDKQARWGQAGSQLTSYATRPYPRPNHSHYSSIDSLSWLTIRASVRIEPCLTRGSFSLMH